MKQQKVIPPSIPTLNAVQARAKVNRFLLSQIGSQFCAGEADYDGKQDLWKIPILLITPGYVAGQVGEALLDATTHEMEDVTSAEHIHKASEKLRKQHHAAIQAAFLQENSCRPFEL